MESTEKKQVKEIKSYWSQNTKLYPTYSKLWDANVPDSGNAPTPDGESIRSIGRLLYEWCNNGNCNALEVENNNCPDCSGFGYEESEECCSCNGEGTDEDGDDCYNCGGSGEEEGQECSTCDGECSVDGERSVNEYYEDMLSHIQYNVPNSDDEVQAVRDVITSDKNYDYDYDQNEVDVYNALADKVVEHVMQDPKNFDPTNKDKKVEDIEKVEKVEVIEDGYRKTTEDERKVFKYLNRLRDSGRTNMFGASPYVQKEMGIEKIQAIKYVVTWMNNFDESGRYSQVKIEEEKVPRKVEIKGM